MARRPNPRPGGARQSAAGQRLRGKSNTANRPKPGVGLGQAAASNFISSTGTAASFGAYDSGSTLDKIARNEWLNTLDPATRARAMNKMGYWTEGVRVRPPALSKADIKYYQQAASGLAPGSMYQPQGVNGEFLGTFTVGDDGKVRYEALGKGKGKVFGKGKGRDTVAGLRGRNTGANAPGGLPVVGPPVPASAAGGPSGTSFTTGVSGATGQFITEAGGTGPAGEASEAGTNRPHHHKKKGRNKKLVKRVVKKTDVKGKAVRAALRSPGVTARDKKVYARIAKTNPKLSSRLRARDRKK